MFLCPTFNPLHLLKVLRSVKEFSVKLYILAVTNSIIICVVADVEEIFQQVNRC